MPCSQLSILDQLHAPGLYQCTTPWTNEMGYRWAPGDSVVVVAQSSPDAVTCCWPGEESAELVFQLSADRFASHFAPV